MIQTENIVIKTNGDTKHQFQQLICGLIIAENVLKIPVMFISSKKFQEEFTEYFNYAAKFITLEDVAKESYFYNPAVQEEYLNSLQKGVEYKYFVFEANCEFKAADLEIMEYIQLKTSVHKLLFSSIHDYVFPQIDNILDLNKINVGIKYDLKNEEAFRKKCNVKLYNYINLSDKYSSYFDDDIRSFNVTDTLLSFVVLNKCDMIICDSIDVLLYESCFRRQSMIHQISELSPLETPGESNNIVNTEKVFHNDCMFPNSQLLLKYI